MRLLICCIGAVASAVLAPLASSAADGEPAFPPEGFTATIYATSNYVFRGLTQATDDPALQGEIAYEHEFGDGMRVFASVWASNFDFDVPGEGDIEVDLTAGTSFRLGPAELSLSSVYYWYPGTANRLNYDYWEVIAQIAYSPVKGLDLTGTYGFSPDNFGSSGDAHYIHAAADYRLPLGSPFPLTLSAGFGRQTIEDEAAFGAPDYFEWSVGLSAEIGRAVASAAYIDNDIDGGDDANFVFTLAVSF